MALQYTRYKGDINFPVRFSADGRTFTEAAEMSVEVTLCVTAEEIDWDKREPKDAEDKSDNDPGPSISDDPEEQ